MPGNSCINDLAQALQGGCAKTIPNSAWIPAGCTGKIFAGVRWCQPWEWTSTTKALWIVPVIRYGGCSPTLQPMDTCRMHVAEALWPKVAAKQETNCSHLGGPHWSASNWTLLWHAEALANRASPRNCLQQMQQDMRVEGAETPRAK